MERTKKFLNISIAISIILCSLSIFIFSIGNAYANPTTSKLPVETDEYTPVGIHVSNFGSGDIVSVIGYNKTKVQGQKIKILSTQNLGEIR